MLTNMSPGIDDNVARCTMPTSNGEEYCAESSHLLIVTPQLFPNIIHVSVDLDAGKRVGKLYTMSAMST
jgi:hypothetical protein